MYRAELALQLNILVCAEVRTTKVLHPIHIRHLMAPSAFTYSSLMLHTVIPVTRHGTLLPFEMVTFIVTFKTDHKDNVSYEPKSFNITKNPPTQQKCPNGFPMLNTASLQLTLSIIRGQKSHHTQNNNGGIQTLVCHKKEP